MGRLKPVPLRLAGLVVDSSAFGLSGRAGAKMLAPVLLQLAGAKVLAPVLTISRAGAKMLAPVLLQLAGAKVLAPVLTISPSLPNPPVKETTWGTALSGWHTLPPDSAVSARPVL